MSKTQAVIKMVEKTPKTTLVIFLLSLSLAGGNAILWAEEKEEWRMRWERTVLAAKREGQVNVYTTFPEVLDVGVFQRGLQSKP